jgi:hypothetical protein
MMGQLKGHCRARAKTNWHDWRSKVESNLLCSLSESYNAFKTEQSTINEHIARIGRHREVMTNRSAFLKEEIRKLQARKLSDQQRAQLQGAAQRKARLEAELAEKTAQSNKLVQDVAALKSEIAALSVEVQTLWAEKSTAMRSLSQASVRVSTEQVAKQGNQFDGYCALSPWRPRLVRVGVIEFEFGADVTLAMRFQGNMTRSLVEEVTVISKLPEMNAIKCDHLRNLPIREVV